MWKLWHALFGAHYVVLDFGWSEHVRRVLFTSAGKPYVKVCGTHCWLLDRREKWEALTFDKEAWLAERKPGLRAVS